MRGVTAAPTSLPVELFGVLRLRNRGSRCTRTCIRLGQPALPAVPARLAAYFVLPLLGHPLPLRGAFLAALVRLFLEAEGDGGAGVGRGEAAFGGLAQAAREGTADADRER